MIGRQAMTKKYSIVNDGEIVDNTSEVVITIPHKNDVKEICKKLNSGSGFNGFTPSFFSKNYLSESA